MIVEHLEGQALEGGVHRRDLREDVDAVAVVLDHPLDPTDLAFDAVQALRQRSLVVPVLHVPSRIPWNLRSRKLFATTKSDDNAIAAAAIIGFSSPATARGIAATLYANAQKRLPLIVRSVRRASRIASTTARRSPETRVTSLASMATSVPVPIASPRSACASAGASLMPSPTMATTCPASCRRFTSANLSSGYTSASTRSIPTSAATRSATVRSSPVRRIGRKPSPFNSAIAAALVGLTASRTARVARE